ncbi:MAG: NADH-quinone oxidoreductase subunit NuoK [Deltaproteobacteria bacterium]|uniref:NADH-quinone oxidoreductase subunit K n=1 Tax=Candidatus Zymogenus saltonus TaxID=2844893 RepID=A0A9D8PNI3_9DELT|nr:NADH-quinone oxidoreductase subunit NuoK [Candidatus Zymogenus saltonus]
MITTTHYLILAAIVFAIGAFGVLTRRNLLVMLMSVELMLNSANLTFVAFARNLGDMGGHIFPIFIMTVAACEVAVGLAIIVTIFRLGDTSDVLDLTFMKDIKSG